jgi:hypothetical protein
MLVVRGIQNCEFSGPTVELHNVHVTEQAGLSCIHSALYSEDSRFETRPGHRLS